VYTGLLEEDPLPHAPAPQALIVAVEHPAGTEVYWSAPVYENTCFGAVQFEPPVPASAILCAPPFVPLVVKFKAPGVRVPLPVGVNRTVSAQLLPAATVVQLFPINENSVGLPEIGGEATTTVSGPSPVLLTVKVLSEKAA
jgi:hypothetical protein